jgi:hypothetical protein
LPQRSNLDDLDPSLLVAGIGRLAQKTGIPAEEIYQTLVASIESKIGATVNYLPHTKRPWLTRYGCSREDGKPGLVFKYATDFCARCLTESVPYFRLSWRFSLFVSCLEHKCLLSDGRNSREQSIRVPNDRYGSAAGRSLLVPDSPLRRNPSLSIEIQNLQALHMRFFTDVRSRSYFEALHCLLHLIILKEFYCPSFFESRSPKGRYDLLKVALHCFRQWPKVPLTAERRDIIQRQPSFANLPEWFKENRQQPRG